MRLLQILLIAILVTLTTLQGQESNSWPPKIPKIDKKPTLLKKADPVYPDSALKTGVTGDVYVNVQVQSDGSPDKIGIEFSDDSLLNESALSTAKTFLFTPAMSEDEPVADWVMLLFSYKQVFEDSHQFHLTALSMDELNKEISVKLGEPKINKKVVPAYPRMAWEAGIEGRVIVKLHVRTDGSPDSVRVLKSDNRLLSDAAVEAAKQFRFEPATLGTKKVPIWVSFPFRFRAAKGVSMEGW